MSQSTSQPQPVDPDFAEWIAVLCGLVAATMIAASQRGTRNRSKEDQ